MSVTSAAAEYRPRRLQDLLGQPLVVTALANMVKANTLPQFIVIAGKFGCGKSSAARLIAAIATCKHLNMETATPCGTCQDCETAFDGVGSGANYMFVDGGGTGMKALVDTDLKSFVHAAPFGGSRRRVVVADEAQGMSKEARTTLLTLTENLPATSMVIMTTTDAQAIDPALMSRACKFYIAPFSDVDLVEAVIRHRPQMDDPEGREALMALAPEADGSMRGMWNVLERAEAYHEPLTPDLVAVIGGGAPKAARDKVWTAVAKSDFAGIQKAWKAMMAKGAEPNRLASQLAEDLFAQAAAAPLARDWVTAIRLFSQAQVLKDEQAMVAALLGMVTPREGQVAGGTEPLPAQASSAGIDPETLLALADSIGRQVQTELKQTQQETHRYLTELLARQAPVETSATQTPGLDPLDVVRELTGLLELPTAAEIAELVVARMQEHQASQPDTHRFSLEAHQVTRVSPEELPALLAQAAAKRLELEAAEEAELAAEAVPAAKSGELVNFRPRIDLDDTEAVYLYVFEREPEQREEAT